MIYRLDEIVRDVRIAIDQNMDGAPLLADRDEDTLSLEKLIRSKALEGVIRVESAAPAEYLEGGHSFRDSGIFWEPLECGWIILPDDFMRLISFKMSDWERPVYRAITATDPEYQKQSSRYKGIRGTPQKPVCAIVKRSAGKVLEFYSCKSRDAYISQANYKPYPIIDESEGVDISKRCYRAVVYTIAALVLTTLGEAEKGSALLQLSNSLLE